jgi:hypothetical protein
MAKHQVRTLQVSLRLLTVGLYLAWASTICCGQNANPRFSLSIATPLSAVKVGDELRLDIVLTNTSKQEYPIGVEIETNHAERDYQISVVDSEGDSALKVVPLLLPNGKHKPHMAAGSHYSRVLKPGARIDSHAILNRLCDLTKPGEYTIQVKRSDPDSKMIVRSNIITVAISR